MIPFGHETVTLFHRTETLDAATGRKTAVYTKYTLHDCSWHAVKQLTRDGEAHTYGSSITVRVPPEYQKPEQGDLMVHGDYTGTVESGSGYQRIIEEKRAAEGAFEVQSATNGAMDGFPLPHYKATGWL